MALDLGSLPNVPMRAITMVLLVLVTWATVGNSYSGAAGSPWLGMSYLLANYFVVLLGLWAERDTPSPIPVQFFFFGMLFTLLNDIISLGITYSGWDDLTDKIGGVSRHTFQFNAAMAIILVLGKPVASLFIYKEWQDRVSGVGGDPSSNYETLGGQGGYSSVGGGGYGGYNGKNETPPQYQPPSNQPFP